MLEFRERNKIIWTGSAMNWLRPRRSTFAALLLLAAVVVTVIIINNQQVAHQVGFLFAIVKLAVLHVPHL